MLSPSQVIVLATPVFLALIAAEYAWGRRRGRQTYRLDDAASSIALGMLSQLAAVFTTMFSIGLYTLVHDRLALWRPDHFWTTWYGWLLALVFYDLCYYWLHRAGHEVGVLWAAHVVHHQSQAYNLSTALRQPATGMLLGWVFYLPMALAGVPPLVFGVVALIDLLYQFWVHTEHVGKLGWFDRWFCSPSNHRVHHAVNDRYLDRNYGGILVVWDRLFGTFQEEDERCVYGTRAPAAGFNPLWSNLEVYARLARDSWHTRRWRDKLRVWLKPPGWRPADVATRWPQPPFDIAARPLFHPAAPPPVQWAAGAQFLLLLGGVAAFLWRADAMPLGPALVWLAALVAGLWGLGALLEGRLGLAELAYLDLAIAATATAALGEAGAHAATKPLVLLFAIVYVAYQAIYKRLAGSFHVNLLVALGFSLAGDCLLLFEDGFIAGLASFLLAHLALLRLFSRGVPWFASGRALAATGALAGLMVAVLWPGLMGVLKAAVPLYALALGAMAAQAIGRATVLREAASVQVAVGACLFMASDALLALDRFWAPIPLAPLWVLATYYAAQGLIVRGALRGTPGARSGTEQAA